MINNLVVMKRGNLVQNRINRIANPDVIACGLQIRKSFFNRYLLPLIGIYNPDANNDGFAIHMNADRIANPDVFACGLKIRKSQERCVYFRIANPKEQVLSILSTLIGIYNPDANNDGFLIHVKADRIANSDMFACGLQIRKSLESVSVKKFNNKIIINSQ